MISYLFHALAATIPSPHDTNENALPPLRHPPETHRPGAHVFFVAVVGLLQCCCLRARVSLGRTALHILQEQLVRC